MLRLRRRPARRLPRRQSHRLQPPKAKTLKSGRAGGANCHGSESELVAGAQGGPAAAAAAASAAQTAPSSAATRRLSRAVASSRACRGAPCDADETAPPHPHSVRLFPR
jgi:hypothetical protein